jgi:hypothetical protein
MPEWKFVLYFSAIGKRKFLGLLKRVAFEGIQTTPV